MAIYSSIWLRCWEWGMGAVKELRATVSLESITCAGYWDTSDQISNVQLFATP